MPGQKLMQTFKTLANVGVRWNITYHGKTAFYNDEGDTIAARVTVANPIAGCSVRVWIGNLMANEANDNWSMPWTQMCQEEAARHTGVTYTPTSDATHSINTTGIFTFAADYDGLPLILSRVAQKDLTTEGDIQGDIFIDNVSTGSIAGNVMSFVVRDNSFTPPGTPTFRAERTNPSSFMNEGEQLIITLRTENMVPGTTCEMQCVNTANNPADWVENLTTQWQAACNAVGCTYTALTSQTGRITWGPTYVDSNPIVFTRTTAMDHVTEASSEQCDYLFNNHILGPGAPYPLKIYGRVISIWIVDTSQDPTVPAFQIRVSPNNPNPGDVITYTLSSESGASGGGTVVIDQSGGATDADFNKTLDALMADLVASEPANMSYNAATNTITVNGLWSGSASATRTLNVGSTATKHIVSLSSPGGGAVLMVAEDICYIGGSGAVAPFTFAGGLNENGAEFGTGGLINPTRVMDYHTLKGFHLARMPFKWEWAQPTLNGALSAAFAGYVNMVKYWTNTKGGFALLDCHNFGNYNDGSGAKALGIGPTKTSPQALCDLWIKVLAAMQTAGVDMTKLMIDPMNEPGNVAAVWRRAGQAVTNAIRCRAGFLGMIAMEGNGSSSAQFWISGGIGSEMLNYYDPANNYCFSPHTYFDETAAGIVGSCSVSSYKRLDAVTAWALANNKKLLLGEFAWGDDSVAGNEQCAVEFPLAMAKMRDNKAAWIGWTWWGAGTFWNLAYPYRLDPLNTAGNAYVYDGSVPDTQQMVELATYLEFIP